MLEAARQERLAALDRARLSTASEIDRIMRQPAAQQQATGKDKTMTATGNLSGLHGPRDTANRITSLERDGITQLTRDDLKAMTGAQIVKAREEGRLLRLLTGQ